jgi:hypothetical protein
MAKGGKMSIGNGGMFGSGIFGIVGSTVQCNSNDTSMYCRLSKMVGGIMMVIYLIIFILILLHVLWNRSYYYNLVFGKMKKK